MSITFSGFRGYNPTVTTTINDARAISAAIAAWIADYGDSPGLSDTRKSLMGSFDRAYESGDFYGDSRITWTLLCDEEVVWDALNTYSRCDCHRGECVSAEWIDGVNGIMPTPDQSAWCAHIGVMVAPIDDVYGGGA